MLHAHAGEIRAILRWIPLSAWILIGFGHPNHGDSEPLSPQCGIEERHGLRN